MKAVSAVKTTPQSSFAIAAHDDSSPYAGEPLMQSGGAVDAMPPFMQEPKDNTLARHAKAAKKAAAGPPGYR